MMWEFPKIRGTLLGVPILRRILQLFWGLYWAYFQETTTWKPQESGKILGAHGSKRRRLTPMLPCLDMSLWGVPPSGLLLRDLNEIL